MLYQLILIDMAAIAVEEHAILMTYEIILPIQGVKNAEFGKRSMFPAHGMGLRTSVFGSSWADAVHRVYRFMEQRKVHL